MSAAARKGPDERAADPRAAKLFPLLEPVVSDAGLYVEELEVQAQGSRAVVHVCVDYYTGTESVDLDTLGEISTALSLRLDEAADHPVLTSLPNYDLEVSTPGATRPLTQRRHFERNIGRLLEISLQDSTSLVARLVNVDDQGVIVQERKEPPKKGMPVKYGSGMQITLEFITKARVQVEFSSTTTDL